MMISNQPHLVSSQQYNLNAEQKNNILSVLSIILISYMGLASCLALIVALALSEGIPVVF